MNHLYRFLSWVESEHLQPQWRRAVLQKSVVSSAKPKRTDNILMQYLPNLCFAFMSSVIAFISTATVSLLCPDHSHSSPEHELELVGGQTRFISQTVEQRQVIFIVVIIIIIVIIVKAWCPLTGMKQGHYSVRYSYKISVNKHVFRSLCNASSRCRLTTNILRQSIPSSRASVRELGPQSRSDVVRGSSQSQTFSSRRRCNRLQLRWTSTSDTCLMWTAYMSVHSLSCMWAWTGSQCSCCGDGATWSRWPRLNTRRAAQFWTSCNGSIDDCQTRHWDAREHKCELSVVDCTHQIAS